MGDPFVGEIKLVSFQQAPKGWALCNGQLLPINQNQALFSLLGTMYGGNGTTNFALPDLRGRVAIHLEPDVHHQGTKAGEESHTVTPQELPQHTHVLQSSGQVATLDDPAGAVFAAASAPQYAGAANAVMHPSMLTSVGGSQPHQNMQPYLVLNYIIALVGVFPARN